MSASAVKATRRQIRRAVGEQGVDLVGSHHEAIGRHAQALDALMQRMGRQEHLLDAMNRHSLKLSERVEWWLRRPLGERLRWLVLGR